MIEKLRYPIGTFSFDESAGSQQIDEWISDIDRLPESLAKAVTSLSEDQLNTPYREGGWTIRQVVHHLADSHMNALIRTKLLLTEDKPTIKPFDEQLWAKLRDNELPVEASLNIIQGVHRRWVRVLEFVEKEEWDKPLHHPENGDMTLKHLTAMYAWHGNHHLAHITNLKDQKNW
ncbi:MAG: putative metal-dependent hydrolase [Balneolaceae bacterium]|nr:putative metal-dependent hydrolase [Balneolaceae bacterium]